MDLEDRFIRRALRVAAGAGIVLLLSGASTVAAEATIPHPPPAVTEAVKELDSAWEQAPLSFTKALFIEAPASGYGLYTPRADAVFSPSAPIIVYLEPVGYSRSRDDDRYRIALHADYEVRTSKGQVLVSQQDFAAIGTTAYSPLREFQTNLRFTFEGLQAGDYVLMIRLKDDATGKVGEIELPFTVGPAQAQNPQQ